MTYQQVISSVVALLFFFSTGIVVAQTQDEEFQQLYEEYLEINERLQQLQQQALQNEEVAEHYEEYSSFLDDKIREIDPGASDLIQQREETIESIEEAQMGGDMETAQHLQQEDQQLNQQLQPYMQQAMEDPEVQERRDEFEEHLIDEMEQIDPEAVPLFNRMEELSRELDRMMQEQQH